MKSEKPPIMPQQNMAFQDRFNAQEENTFFADGRAMRTPVEGTVALGKMRGDNVGFFEGLDESGNYLMESPVEWTRDLLYRGKDRYDIFCSVCHGGTGDGRGIIMTGQYGYVPAPTFHSDRIRGLPDGEIYSAIANGVRNMPSYATQIPVEDRWAIVAYVRALQQSQNVPEDEMQQYDVDLASLKEEFRIAKEEAEALAAARAASQPVEEVSASRGEGLYTMYACQTCHSVDGRVLVGPSFQNLFGSTREFEDGTTAMADEDYLYESITMPAAKISKGYINAMPAYDYLTDGEVNSLIEFIKTHSEN
jgi:mono/diheme cytochrome c family protein